MDIDRKKENRIKSIDERTLIPVGLAVITIGGGIAWLTALYDKTEALAQDMQSKDVLIHRMTEDIHAIRLDIEIIKHVIKREK